MAVIAALKSKGVSTIGVAGFCWGGKASLMFIEIAAVFNLSYSK